MTHLSGKVALVTGAGRGIGHAVVELLASQGADLVLNDLDEEPAREAAAAARAHGVRAVVKAGSISARTFGDEFVEMALDEFGAIDIIVNNAGYATYAPAEDTTDEDFDAVVDVLVAAPFRILRAAGRYFRDQAAVGGSDPRKVVNVASIGGLMGAPTQVAYGVGKAGILGLTGTLASEWGKYNVNVNAVAPGLTRTRLTEGPAAGVDSIMIDGREHAIPGMPLGEAIQMLPLQRIGTPADIAGCIYMLCSRYADFVTGQTLVVDGGMRPGR
ncbi:SDR family NAD(P)-dependent oxidoreductase [Rhodococcus koreensis]